MDIFASVPTWFLFVFLQVYPLAELELEQVLRYQFEPNRQIFQIQVASLKKTPKGTDLILRARWEKPSRHAESYFLQLFLNGESWELIRFQIGQSDEVKNPLHGKKISKESNELRVSSDWNYILTKIQSQSTSLRTTNGAQLTCFQEIFEDGEFQVEVFHHTTLGLIGVRFFEAKMLDAKFWLYPIPEEQKKTNPQKQQIKHEKVQKLFFLSGYEEWRAQQLLELETSFRESLNISALDWKEFENQLLQLDPCLTKLAEEYASKFTEEELDILLQWYETPVAQKWLKQNHRQRGFVGNFFKKEVYHQFMLYIEAKKQNQDK